MRPRPRPRLAQPAPWSRLTRFSIVNLETSCNPMMSGSWLFMTFATDPGLNLGLAWDSMFHVIARKTRAIQTSVSRDAPPAHYPVALADAGSSGPGSDPPRSRFLDG